MQYKSAVAVILIAVATTASPSALSQERTDCVPAMLPGVSMFLNFSGECRNANYLNQDRTKDCSGEVTSVAYRHGRVGYTFRLNPSTDIVFTGGKDSQPTKTLYQLDIDKMAVTKEGDIGNQVVLAITGTCVLNIAAKEAAIITCKADAGGKKVAFEFVANNAPAITRFCPPN